MHNYVFKFNKLYSIIKYNFKQINTIDEREYYNIEDELFQTTNLILQVSFMWLDQS